MTDYTQFSGTVKRRFPTKNGYALALNVRNPRRDYPDEVAVWADLDVAEGDWIVVRGHYSDRIDSYDTPSGPKLTIRRNLNEVSLIERTTTQPADDTPPDDPWGPVAPIPNDESTPF